MKRVFVVLTRNVTRFLIVLRGGAIAVILASLLIPRVHAQTQASMNAEARSDFARADADLNKTYQSVSAKLRNAESKQKLMKTQRAWVAFRDAEAARAAKEEASGGSMAPTIRYEAMTQLTRERIKELRAMLEDETASPTKRADSNLTASPNSPPQPEREKAQSASEAEHAPSSSLNSFSPDKRWEYRCEPYADHTECAPEVVRAGTTDVVLDLNRELEVSGSESIEATIFWAPDSKRFAFNYSPVHAHHTTYETVAFYQLNGDKWMQLPSPVEETEHSQLVELAKKHLLKSFNPRTCTSDRDALKLRSWADANTAILYGPCYGRTSGELEAGFLFTLKFDDAGNWKIVTTHRMSKKELEQQEKER